MRNGLDSKGTTEDLVSGAALLSDVGTLGALQKLGDLFSLRSGERLYLW